MATWGGSTAGNLESIEENEYHSDEDDEDDDIDDDDDDNNNNAILANGLVTTFRFVLEFQSMNNNILLTQKIQYNINLFLTVLRDFVQVCWHLYYSFFCSL